MAIMGISICTNKDRQCSRICLLEIKHFFFAFCNIKHITGIRHNLTGQAVVERSNQTVKNMLNKQKGIENIPEIDCVMLY